MGKITSLKPSQSGFYHPVLLGLVLIVIVGASVIFLAIRQSSSPAELNPHAKPCSFKVSSSIKPAESSRQTEGRVIAKEFISYLCKGNVAAAHQLTDTTGAFEKDDKKFLKRMVGDVRNKILSLSEEEYTEPRQYGEGDYYTYIFTLNDNGREKFNVSVVTKDGHLIIGSFNYSETELAPGTAELE